MNQFKYKITGSVGGGINEPNGGFLPIYICDKPIDEPTTSDDIQKREFESPIKSISIKTLMEKRRAKNPLLSMISK